MLAIFKKELKSYFHSMIGYVFMAFFLVVIGIYMYVYNFAYQVANFEYVLNSVTFIFIILVPILTMRLMAEEKKQKTDQLLFTSSVSVTKIVLAKFFAVVALFTICMAVVCIYPLILRIFGEVPFGTAYSSIVGFYIMGAALLAIGLFISSLTESQIIAAVISFIVLLFTYLAASLGTVLPTEKLPTMLITLFLFAIFSYIIYISIRKVYVAVGTWVVGTIILIALYFFKSSFYDNLLAKMISAVAVMEPFQNFCYGNIAIADVVYYLSIAALFIILTSLFVKESLSDKQRVGSVYRTGLMVGVAVLCVVVNLFANELNLSVDLSSEKLYSLTDKTKDFVKELDSDITIYYVCQEGNEDVSVEKLVNKYSTLNDKIEVVKKDQVLYPTFTSKYSENTVYDNSIIVENNDTGTYKVVSYYDMYQAGYDSSGSYSITGVDVEGQITSALDYVTNEDLPVLYYTSGHGEVELGETIISAVSKQNVAMNELKTVTVSEIPEDCDILVINGPTTDLSDEEVRMIKVYLANGGDAIFTLQYTTNDMTNYTELLKYYGIYPKDGLVVEQYGNYMSGYMTNIIPSYGSHEIMESIEASKKYVVMPNSIGFTLSDTVRDTVTLTELLTTSDGSYSKINLESENGEFEDGDINGPFTVGVLAEEDSESQSGETMKLAVYSSVFLFDESIISTGQFANADIFANTVGYMADTSSTISIPVTSLSATYLTIPTVAVNVLGAVFVIVIPLGILITGLVIWLRRRKS